MTLAVRNGGMGQGLQMGFTEFAGKRGLLCLFMASMEKKKSKKEDDC